MIKYKYPGGELSLFSDRGGVSNRLLHVKVNLGKILDF